MVSETSEPAAASPATRGPGIALGPFVLGFLVVTGLGKVCVLALASALFGLGLWLSLAVALVPGLLFPLAVAFRASRTLARRGSSAGLRVITALVAALAIEVGILVLVLGFIGRTVGDVAAVGNAVVTDTVGELPVVTRVLTKLASGARTTPDPGMPYPRPGPPVPAAPASVDGGALADAGTRVAAAPATMADGGALPAEATDDARPPGATIDGGTDGAAESPASFGSDAALVAASLVKLSDGTPGVVVHAVSADGEVDHRFVSLAPFTKEGNAASAHTGPEGTTAVRIGTATVVVVSPSGAPARIGPLSRGHAFEATSALGDDLEIELRAVQDVRVLGGETLLVVAQVMVDGGTGPTLQSALLALPKGAADPLLLRKEGDDVPGAEGAKVVGFALKGTSPFGMFAVVERFAAGGKEVKLVKKGASWKMSEERLLFGHGGAPTALSERGRTGEAVGAGDRHLQAFLDVALVSDERALADVAFLEASAQGTVLDVRALSGGASGVAPLGGEAGAAPGAPWGQKTPRARYLTAEADGAFAFISPEGALTVGDIERPLAAKALLRRAKVARPDGTPAGRVEAPERPALARGGGFGLVEVRQSDGQKGTGLVLFTLERGAHGAGDEHVLALAEGDPAPEGAPAGTTVSALSFLPRDPDRLW